MWLHRFAVLVAVSTVLLIAAGGMVTSTDSGLAVPDWPNTYGRFMFSFPFEKMVGGILYEHGHRLIASTVGFLTIILAVWTWRVDGRRSVRRLALAALAAVIVQGLLGGVTVLLLLPATVSIGHAGLAQLFFCMTVALALVTSRSWRERPAVPDDARLRRLALATTLAVYIQILLGATVRHTEAGMAIPDFPLSYGRLIPPFWSAAIALHFAHRVGAIVVTAAVLLTVIHVRRAHRSTGQIAAPALLMLFLVAAQVTLGAYVVLSGLQPIVNTAHVVNGALVLAASLDLTLRSFRPAWDRDARARSAHAVPHGPTILGARP
jgi:cytochrome c oxidase assembly protein subunit 15